MTEPTIAGKRVVYSASGVLEALGHALGEIKTQDRLTWADIGAVLGVSDDQAAKYAEGTATMSVITFGRGRREWNGRFTGYFDRLCTESRTVVPRGDQNALTAVLQAASVMAKLLEDDGLITVAEILRHRAELETAFDAIGAQLNKLRPAA